MVTRKKQKGARPAVPMASAELDELRAKFESIQTGLASSLSAPLYPTKLLIKSGIPRGVINNWNTRKFFQGEFALDADNQREGNRLYSARDALFLSAIQEFSGIGAPLDVAKKAAKLMVNFVVGSTVLNSGRAQIVIFRRDGEWWLIPQLSLSADKDKGIGLPERQMRAAVFSDGKWREEKIGQRSPDAPPLRMVFDIGDFASGVFRDLGLNVMFGKADEIQAKLRAQGK